VEFVRLNELTSHGFGARFADLAMAAFPGACRYMGAKAGIGL